MKIIIDEPKIKKYKLIPAEVLHDDPRFSNVFFMDSFRNEKGYFILYLEEIEEGFMVNSITAKRGRVKQFLDRHHPLLQNCLYGIRVKEQEILELKFTFKGGYPLYVYDEAMKLTYVSYHPVNQIIDIVNKGFYKNRIVKGFEFSKSSDINYQEELISSLINIKERELTFKMPNRRVDLSILYHEDKFLNVLTFNLDNIKKDIYQELEWANHFFDCFFSLAVYSDDYDTGLKDEHLYDDKEYYVQNNQSFIVVLNLLKKVNKIKAYFNNELYDYYLMTEEVTTVLGYEDIGYDEIEHKDKVYQYILKMKVNKSGQFYFELEE